jgi:hypothetical protein
MYFKNGIIDNRVNLRFENFKGGNLLLGPITMVHLIYWVELRLHIMNSNYYEFETNNFKEAYKITVFNSVPI